MLTSVILELEAEQDGSLPVSHGRALHGMFIKLVHHLSPSILEQLHEHDGSGIGMDEPHERPFTLCHLTGDLRRDRNMLSIKHGNVYNCRITGLNEAVSGFLLDFDITAVGKLILSGLSFTLRRVIRSPDEHPDVAKCSYLELTRRYLLMDREELSALPDRIDMSFISPTTFREAWKTFPLPAPEKVFTMLIAKWEAWSPLSFKNSEHQEHREQLLNLTRSIVVAGFELRSRLADFGDYRLVGFVGDCQFLLKPSKKVLVRERLFLKQWFYTLADFAFFAGIGYKTTMGMGQVRVSRWAATEKCKTDEINNRRSLTRAPSEGEK